MSSFGKFAAGMGYHAKKRMARAAAQTKREQEREKEKDDAALLFKLWQKWHAERKKEVLAGPHGVAVKPLLEFLERMAIDDGDELIERYAQLGDIDMDSRHEILALIDARCIMIRERIGLAPFDDDLADPPETVFLQIREMYKDGKS